MAKRLEDEWINRILTQAEGMTPEEEQTMLDKLLLTGPHLGVDLCRVYFEKSRRLEAKLAQSAKQHQELKAQAEKLAAPPWYPCDFIRYSTTHQKAIVNSANRKLMVSVHPSMEAEIQHLCTGAEVYLSHELNCIIALGEPYARTGMVGLFDRYDRGRAVLKGAADQEIIVDLAPELTSEMTLRSGDRVLFDADTRIAYERVERSQGDGLFLEDTPTLSFDDIGGLDEVIDELREEIALNVFHGELAKRHKLHTAKGILLSGPPGCGKTMLAKAVAHYIAQHLQPEKSNGFCKFLNIKPGSQRSMWYGQTEANVREIFRVARETSQTGGWPVVLFWDELDNVGARSADWGTAIDSRVLTAFLAEIDGLEEVGHILLIGATNRPDLLDDALMRPGRFGDKVFMIPRPNREAAEAIFAKYLTADLPYALNGNGANGAKMAGALIEAAVSHIYAPRGEGNRLATLTLRDGKKQPVYAPEVMSGALIANVVREAKRRSVIRGARGRTVGITRDDLLRAIDRELETIAIRLKKIRSIHTILSELPDDIDVVRVEVQTGQQHPRSYEYLRSPM